MILNKLEEGCRDTSQSSLRVLVYTIPLLVKRPAHPRDRNCSRKNKRPYMRTDAAQLLKRLDSPDAARSHPD